MASSQRKRRKVTEEELVDKLFGDNDADQFDDFGKEVDDSVETNNLPEAEAWVFDRAPSGTVNQGNESNTKSFKRTEAWVDEDDGDQQVNISKRARLRKLRKEEEDVIQGDEYSSRLRSQFKSMQKSGTSWATLPSQQEDVSDDDDDIGILSKTMDESKSLPPNVLSVKRCKNANDADPASAAILSVQFHPNAQLLLTAGLDKTLRLFQIDGKNNPKLQSVHFKDMPIHTARFNSDGSQAWCSGRRKFYYTVDVEKGVVDRIHGIIGREERSLENFVLSPDNSVAAFYGNDGNIILVDMNTKQYVANMKMNGAFRSAGFTSCGSYLYTGGDHGNIYKWDMRTRKCLHVHADEGALSCSSLAVSPNGDHYASGSKSGVVNVYDAEKAAKSRRPKPMSTLMNLVTDVDTLLFNPTGDIMAMASRMKKEALRLVHFPSVSVLANWPTAQTPLHYVHCVDFSSNSGYIAMGNAKGKALLYRLNHFSSS